MNFADLRFWGFLLAGFSVVFGCRLIVWVCRPAFLERFDKIALLSLGMFLLFCISYVTFLIWLSVSAGTYLGLWLIIKHHKAPEVKYLWVLVPLQLAPLFFFKYANFTLNGILGMNVDPVRHLLIPVGISFYTFQKVAFAVDTLQNGEPLPKFLDYMNFAGFFPQIAAGPIERKRDLLSQMQQFRFCWDAANFDVGISWIVLGLFFKCCLADNFAWWMEYFSTSTSNAYEIWVTNVIFCLRCYYDFAGYSLIALGVAQCLGVKLTLNFASPLCATSIQEFWNRWHITLGRWFRDYVFMPLRRLPMPVNIAIVFIAVGIWHGAGWNFVLFGCIFAGAMIINQSFRKVSISPFIGWASTMAVVILAMVCFYETRADYLIRKLRALSSLSGYSPHAFHELKHNIGVGEWVGFGGMLGLALVTLTMEWFSIRFHDEPMVLLRKPLVLAILVVMTVLLSQILIMPLSTLPSKSRLLPLPFVLACVAVLSLGAAAFYALHWDPEVRFYKYAVELKKKRVDNHRRLYTNVVIFCGDSSCAFSVDGDEMLSKFHLPAVNFGMGGNMGMLFLSAMAVDAAKPGDTVVVQFEPALLVGEGPPSDLAAKMGFALHHLDYVHASNLTGERIHWVSDLLGFRPGAYYVTTFLVKILVRAPLYRYKTEDIRPSGLFTTRFRIEMRDYKGEQDAKLSTNARELLAALSKWGRDRRIQVVYLLPCDYVSQERAWALQNWNVHFLKQVAEFLPVIKDESLGAWSRSDLFGDSEGHFTEEGAAIRSDCIARELQEKKFWTQSELDAAVQQAGNRKTSF